jgi:hypothetical protein
MMPFAALGLKKYLCGGVWVSMISNNEQSLARLGDSEIAAVKHTPSHAIPEFDQRVEDAFEVPSFVGIE